MSGVNCLKMVKCIVRHLSHCMKQGAPFFRAAMLRHSTLLFPIPHAYECIMKYYFVATAFIILLLLLLHDSTSIISK